MYFFNFLKSKSKGSKMVWLFFALILFDGILRKWAIPSLSTPVMLLKHVVAIYIVMWGWMRGLIKNAWAVFSVVLGTIAFFSALFFGHQNIYVALWGGLNWWFGIPLCIIISKVLKLDDVLRMLKVTMYFTIIHCIVTVLQYFSPVSSFLNRQIGDEVVDISSENIAELGGTFRCSGLLGYIAQSSLFAPLALGIALFYLFFNKVLNEKYRLFRFLPVIAIGLFLAMTIFSVSRSTVFFSTFTFVFVFIFILRFSNKLKNVGVYFVLLLLVSISLFSIPAVQKSMGTIGDRFTSAAGSTNSNSSAISGNIQDVINRGVLYSVEAIVDPKTLDGKEIPFWGFGQGMSTQVGGRLLGIKANSGFALAEWDSKRLVAESGLLIGFFMLFCRLGFVLVTFPLVIKNAKRGNFLPCVLFPSFFLGFFFINQWGNSFLFNFSILCGGLFLASAKSSRVTNTN